MGPSLGRTLPASRPPPSYCLEESFRLLGLHGVPKNKLNQRSEQKQKQRETVKEGQGQSAQPLNKPKGLQLFLKGWRVGKESKETKGYQLSL